MYQRSGGARQAGAWPFPHLHFHLHPPPTIHPTLPTCFAGPAAPTLHHHSVTSTKLASGRQSVLSRETRWAGQSHTRSRSVVVVVVVVVVVRLPQCARVFHPLIDEDALQFS